MEYKFIELKNNMVGINGPCSTESKINISKYKEQITAMKEMKINFSFAYYTFPFFFCLTREPEYVTQKMLFPVVIFAESTTTVADDRYVW